MSALAYLVWVYQQFYIKTQMKTKCPLKPFWLITALCRESKKSHLTKRRKRIRLKRCCSLFLYTSACNFLHVSRQGKVVVFNAVVIWEAESCTLQPTTKGGFVSFMTSGIQVTFIVSQRNMLKRQTGHIAEIFRKGEKKSLRLLKCEGLQQRCSMQAGWNEIHIECVLCISSHISAKLPARQGQGMHQAP